MLDLHKGILVTPRDNYMLDPHEGILIIPRSDYMMDPQEGILVAPRGDCHTPILSNLFKLSCIPLYFILLKIKFRFYRQTG